MKEKEFYSSKISDTLEEYLKNYDPEVDDPDSFREEIEEYLEEFKKTGKILSYSIEEPMSDGDLIDVRWYEKIENGEVIYRYLTLAEDFDVYKGEAYIPLLHDKTNTNEENVRGILF